MQDKNVEYPNLEKFKTANHMVDKCIITARVGRKAQMAKQECSKDEAGMHAQIVKDSVKTLANNPMQRRSCTVFFLEFTAIRATHEFVSDHMSQHKGMMNIGAFAYIILNMLIQHHTFSFRLQCLRLTRQEST